MSRGCRRCDLTEANLHAAAGPGEWSVTEIAAHLRSCADVWGEAIETIAATGHPAIRAISPATWIKNTGYRGLAFASSWQAFSKQRGQLIALLGQLPDQGWSRTATVLEGGRPLKLTVHRYADRLARHERTHWKQPAKMVKTANVADGPLIRTCSSGRTLFQKLRLPAPSRWTQHALPRMAVHCLLGTARFQREEVRGIAPRRPLDWRRSAHVRTVAFLLGWHGLGATWEGRHRQLRGLELGQVGGPDCVG